VHELSADGAAIELAGTLGVRSANPQLRIIKREKVAEWIKVRLEVSPAPEKIEDMFLPPTIDADFRR
jgi:hypothetical protein